MIEVIGEMTNGMDWNNSTGIVLYDGVSRRCVGDG